MLPADVILFVVLLYIVVFAVNNIIQIIGDIHYKEKDDIFDVIWKYTPDLYQYNYLTDVLPVVILFSLFFIPRGNSILVEFFLKFLVIMLIRALTTISTILPKHEKCEHEFNIRNVLSGGCYDKIFSGHTAFVALFTMIFYREDIINSWQFWLINIFNMGLITVTRAHYTVDVILGFIITYLVYDGDYSLFPKALKALKQI